MNENILVFCAHSDDEAVGMAGTIAKYVAEYKNVIKVIFSYGESSHPHFQERILKKRRIRETRHAGNFLGIKDSVFLGMHDTRVTEDVERRGIKGIKRIINTYKPEKIFIPSAKDPHPDHQAVHNAVLEAVDSLNQGYHVFAYEVWNVVKEQHPFIYIDITPYFKQKLEYIRFFRSQWQYMYLLWLPVHIRSMVYGVKHGCRYAERFYKIR